MRNAQVPGEVMASIRSEKCKARINQNNVGSVAAWSFSAPEPAAQILTMEAAQ